MLSQFPVLQSFHHHTTKQLESLTQKSSLLSDIQYQGTHYINAPTLATRSTRSTKLIRALNMPMQNQVAYQLQRRLEQQLDLRII